MNRRAFLKLFGSGVAAAIALVNIPAVLTPEPTRLFTGPLTFRGIPLVFDRDCPRNTVYFLNPETLWVNRGDGWHRPFHVGGGQ
jgi:hypothetical protein